MFVDMKKVSQTIKLSNDAYKYVGKLRCDVAVKLNSHTIHFNETCDFMLTKLRLLSKLLFTEAITT